MSSERSTAGASRGAEVFSGPPPVEHPVSLSGPEVVRPDLASVLSEFARTMATDFKIQHILEQLVARIVEILPITAAGVTLISPGTEPRYIAASNDEALHFEQLQTRLGEGPCLMTYRSGVA